MATAMAGAAMDAAKVEAAKLKVSTYLVARNTPYFVAPMVLGS